MDTAAILTTLDLVITSDTALCIWQGLGVPTWVALCCPCDWRWMRDRTDSPWYPTMRLFRQKSWGDWPTVFTEIADALRQKLKHGAETQTPVSAGELLDKITILEIKQERIKDESKLANVRREYSTLADVRLHSLPASNRARSIDSGSEIDQRGTVGHRGRDSRLRTRQGFWATLHRAGPIRSTGKTIAARW